MRMALASHAWTPQGNGGATTLKATAASLAARGLEVHMLRPQGAYVARELATFRPQATQAPADGDSEVRMQHPGGARLDHVPIPLTQRAGVAVSHSSAMIERIAARRQPSQAGDAN